MSLVFVSYSDAIKEFFCTEDLWLKVNREFSFWKLLGKKQVVDYLGLEVRVICLCRNAE